MIVGPRPTNLELATRLRDLVEKWLTGCTTVEAVMEKIVVEQLIETMPRDLKIWIRDRKPASGADAGKPADDYSRARQQELQVSPRVLDHNEVKRCHTCRKTGHLMRDCPQRAAGAEKPDTAKSEPKGDTPPSKDNTNCKPVVCYNCEQSGHIAVRCPNNSNLFCSAVGTRLSVRRPGIVEGTMEQDIILDTGCSQTMVREDLAKTSKLLEGEAVTVRCAHGDTVLYPLSEVELELAGKKMVVRAAISENVPASVLLGTDVPELGSLLSVENLKIGRNRDSYAVTRAQARKDAEEEKARLFKEAVSDVRPTPLLSEISEGQDSEESDHEISDSEVDDSGTNMEANEREECQPQNSSDDWLGTFDENLFEPGKAKKPLSHREKRKDGHEAGLVRAKDKPRKKIDKTKINPPVTKSELVRLQETDGTLAVIRKKAGDASSSEFFWREGVLYKHWRPDAHREVEQIVLPKQCRRTVLELAHSIPMGGHLGKKKTTSRIQQRFYWPTIHHDVADFCRSCEVCQKFRRQQKTNAPMMPFPVIAEPFQRIAMDIVGPLPRSRSGNRYVLVVCDYATRYPEAVPMKTIDAGAVAEDLIKIFSRVGLPKEILTDQGSNFQSELLAELYRLLHISPLRTTPYHPQTDGLVERFNKTLKDMLKKAAVEEGKDWDKLIPIPRGTTGIIRLLTV